MWRKTFLSLCIACSISGVATITPHDIKDIGANGYLSRGKLMYSAGNYTGCIDQLTEMKTLTYDSKLIEEADYYIAISKYERGNKECLPLLEAFVKHYPGSQYTPEAKFYIASFFFFNEYYAQAADRFGDVQENQISSAHRPEYIYRYAYSLLQLKEYNKAERLFMRLQRDSKYSDAATYYIAYIAYNKGDYDKALSGFSRVNSRGAFATNAKYFTAQIYYVKGEYGKVINIGREISAKNLDEEYSTELNRILGESYYHENDDNAAARYLRKYLSVSHHPVRSALYVMGVIDYRNGDYTNALSELVEVTPERDALAQSAYLYIGHCYIKQNDRLSAMMAYEKAYKMPFDENVQEVAFYNYAVAVHEGTQAPFSDSITLFEDFLNRFPNSQYTEKVQDYMIAAYMTTRDYKRALASIERVKRPNERLLTAKQRILYQLGVDCVANGEYSEAKINFTKAQSLGSKVPEIYAETFYWIGECNYNSKQYTTAYQNYEKYMSMSPSKKNAAYPLAQYGMGYSMFKMAKYSQAIPHFTSFVNAPGNTDKKMVADAYIRIGDCNYYARNYAEAERLYTRAHDMSPNDGDYAMYQKAIMQGLQKNNSRKIAILDEMMAAYPHSSYTSLAMMEKAQTYVTLKKPAQAISVYEQLLKTHADEAISRKAMVQLAITYANSGNTDKAISTYKRVISNYPSSAEAKVASDDLKTIYADAGDISTYASYMKSVPNAPHIDVNEMDSLSYYSAEKAYHAKKGNVAAIEKYLSQYPNGAFTAEANYYVGVNAFENKKYDKAITSFNTLLKQKPDAPYIEDILAMKGEILTSEGKHAEALNNYETLVAKASQPETRMAAYVGIVDNATKTGNNAKVIEASKSALKSSSLSGDQRNKILYAQAKAYMATGNYEAANTDWKALSSDTRTVYGAEASFRVAEYLYNLKKMKEAKKSVNAFLDAGTSHAYWMARSYILLADIYLAAGDKYQARQYLESLQENYPGAEADIQKMIKDGLAKAKK